MTVLLMDVEMAGRNLRQHARRNLFLGGALGAITALLVILNGLTSGMEKAMMDSAYTLMTGHVNVGGFFKVTSGSAAPLVSDWPKALATAKEKVPELAYHTVRVRGWAKGVSETASMDLVLGGIDVDQEPMLPKVLRFVEGDLAALRKPNSLLLFQAQAKRLKVGKGDVITLSAPTDRGINNTVDVTVAAVARDVGLLSSFSAFIHAGTLRALYGINETTTGAIHLYLKDPGDAAAVAARLRTAYAETDWRVMEPEAQPYWMKLMIKVPAEDWTGQKIDVTTADEEMDQFKSFIAGLRAVTWVLVIVLLLVVLIGILNTLAIAVRERTKEIGTLRAIGMQRTKVLWLFVLETAMLSVLGTGLGAAAALGIAALVNAAAIVLPPSVQIFLAMEHLRLVVSPGWVAGYVAGISVLTILASLQPARRAARLRPVTAMHHVG